MDIGVCASEYREERRGRERGGKEGKQKQRDETSGARTGRRGEERVSYGC